jgi:hypothetical protein
VLISRSKIGPCKALVWVDVQLQYRCGLLGDRTASVGHLAGTLVRMRNRVIGRWIAAGKGCDCDLDAKLSSTISDPNDESPAP